MKKMKDIDPEALCGETAEEILETCGKYSYPEGCPNPFKGDKTILNPDQWCLENAEKLNLTFPQSD